MAEQKQPFHLIGGAADPKAAAAELARLRAEIAARNGQETAIAELGQAALTGVDPFILIGQACALVEETLGIDHCRALEVTTGGRVVVRAALGTNATFTHCTRDDEENEAISLYVIVASDPVTFSDLDQETRFKCSHLRDFHRVKSGIAVAIPTGSGMFGAILAYSTAARVFEDYEIAFLKSVANLVGEAVARARSELARRRSESRFQQLIASTLDTVISIDRNATVIEWNPQAEAAFGLRAREIVGKPLPTAILPALLEAIAARLPQRRLEGVAKPPAGD